GPQSSGGIRMNGRLSGLLLRGLTVSLVAVPLLSGVAGAQSSDNAIPTAIAGTMLMFFVICGLAVYVYMALALQTIATKTATANPWLAWIPIANLILMLNVAKKPL